MAEKSYLYVWNSPVNDKDTSAVHTIIKDMVKNRATYNPYENIKALAKLLMYSMPGDTIDLLLGNIESHLQSIIKDNPNILLSPFDIQNRIKGVLNDLAYDD